MNLGSNGENMIKSHEGYRSQAYQDVVGVWTIGWGHTKTAVPGMVIDHAQAQDLFYADIKDAVNAVNVYVIGRGVPLNQNQFDALVSLVFNLGSHNIFTKNYNNGYSFGSSLYNLLLKKEYYNAAQRFVDFNKAGGQVISGLTKRRLQEKELFLKSPNESVLESVLSLVAGGIFTWYLTKQFGI